MRWRLAILSAPDFRQKQQSLHCIHRVAYLACPIFSRISLKCRCWKKVKANLPLRSQGFTSFSAFLSQLCAVSEALAHRAALLSAITVNGEHDEFSNAIMRCGGTQPMYEAAKKASKSIGENTAFTSRVL
jgi:hypothetical protein